MRRRQMAPCAGCLAEGDAPRTLVAEPLEKRFEYATQDANRAARPFEIDRTGPGLGVESLGLHHIAAAGEFHLHGLDAFGRFAEGPGDPAAPEAAIHHKRFAAGAENHADRLADVGTAASSGIEAEVEEGQFAVEQARHAGTDRMRVVKRDPSVFALQPGDLGMERGMVGLEIALGPLLDLFAGRGLALPVEGLAVEGRGWAEFGRRLARVERGAARVAVDVDDRPGKLRAHDCRPEPAREGVKLIKPPVGVLPGEPRVHETRLELPKL